MIEIIGGVWAAGETKTFHINGEYLEILEAQYPCDVMLMDRQGAQLSIMRSSEASFFSRPKEGFNSVQITSAQAQSIRVFVGSGDAGTRRISSTVQVVDGGRARTVAGSAFVLSQNVNAVAGMFCGVVLLNPAGSGRRLVLKSSRFSSTVAGSYGLAWRNIALGTAAPNAVVKKLQAGPASVAQATMENNTGAVIPGLAGTNSLVSAVLAANQVDTQTFAEPVVLDPGNGLLWFAGVVSASIIVAAEFTEESLS